MVQWGTSGCGGTETEVVLDRADCAASLERWSVLSVSHSVYTCVFSFDDTDDTGEDGGGNGWVAVIVIFLVLICCCGIVAIGVLASVAGYMYYQKKKGTASGKAGGAAFSFAKFLSN
jgi:hypothetical protein